MKAVLFLRPKSHYRTPGDKSASGVIAASAPVRAANLRGHNERHLRQQHQTRCEPQLSDVDRLCAIVGGDRPAELFHRYEYIIAIKNGARDVPMRLLIIACERFVENGLPE